MNIVSSICPEESIRKMIEKEFPDEAFFFYKGMKEAEQSFYDAEVFITYGEDLTPEHILRSDKLRWIMVMSAGLDQMPLAQCKEKGILITNARGIHAIPMAEFTMSCMLQHVKSVHKLRALEESRTWDRTVHMGELGEKTLLILGVGAIGGEIARLAKAFRMNTIGLNRSGRAVEHIDAMYTINELLSVIGKADFIVAVLPSTKDTFHLLSDEHFKAMKNDAVFINIGRGDLVQESIIVEALQNGEIAHAFLDVFENEPLRTEHPFWHMKRLTVTPHLSSITKKYLPRSFEIFMQNLHTYRKKGNHYINVVDVQKGY